jgi:Lon protease-like protein
MANYHTLADLPPRIPVFPLNGAVLFPRARLPFNIFEPRYLNMIDDAMSGERLIGMIQPAVGDTDRFAPQLADVGCVGRITSYAETDDGRYLIVLTGVIRFAVGEELALRSPYRSVRADYSSFHADLQPDPLDDHALRQAITTTLEAFLARNELRADWSELNNADFETFVHVLGAACPLRPEEKQALLEAPDLASRAHTLKALLQIGVADNDSGEGWLQ